MNTWKCPDGTVWDGPDNTGGYIPRSLEYEYLEYGWRSQSHVEVVEAHGPMSLYGEQDRAIDKIVKILGGLTEGAVDADVALGIAVRAVIAAERDTALK